MFRELLLTRGEDGAPLVGARNIAKVMCLRGHNIERNELSRVIRQTEAANEEVGQRNSAAAVRLRGLGFLAKQTYLKVSTFTLIGR